jgi:hypothetical protein
MSINCGRHHQNNESQIEHINRTNQVQLGNCECAHTYENVHMFTIRWGILDKLCKIHLFHVRSLAWWP